MSDNGNGNNGNGNGNNTTTTVAPTTIAPTTTVAPSTTTTVSINDDYCHHDENLDGGYLEHCDDIHEEIEILRTTRVEVKAHCDMLYSIDTSKLPIIQAYQSDAYDKPHVLILEFDNGKQLKFYTNIRNHPNHQIKHIFLKNEAFQKLIKDLGLNYTIDI